MESPFFLTVLIAEENQETERLLLNTYKCGDWLDLDVINRGFRAGERTLHSNRACRFRCAIFS